MSFSALRGQLNGVKKQEILSYKDYHRSYFNADTQKLLEELKNKNVYYLFEDIIDNSVNKNLEGFLGEMYQMVDLFASECIQIAKNVSDIYGLKIKNWTDLALKCFDPFLFNLISVVLMEKIRTGTKIKERDVYNHLEQKVNEENYYTIGVCFNSIYQSRNSLTHIQIQDLNGVRKYKPFSQYQLKKIKESILFQFKKGLTALEKEIP